MPDNFANENLKNGTVLVFYKNQSFFVTNQNIHAITKFKY